MILRLKIVSFHICVALMFCTCQKQEQPYLLDVVDDPCDCATEVKGGFLIEEETYPGINKKYTITDTIYNGKDVRFTALEDEAEYIWYIGTEVLYTKEVTRHFNNTWSGFNVPITLVTKKRPNLLCFPEDDGYDSTTQIMHVSVLPDWVSPDVDYGPVEGDFRVKSEHLPDSFDISIDMTFISNQTYFNITNYDGYGSTCIQQARPTARNYRQLFGFDGVGTTQCDAMKGDVHIRMDGVVEMNFEFFHNPNYPGYAKRQYLGRKL